ncbi:MAG TPA: hypothetical protein VGK74_19200 [Symbiobacteriaceae bacterium]
MATKKEKLTPEQVEKLEEAAKAALDEVIKKRVMDLVMNATEDDLQGPDQSAEPAKGNTLEATCWVHGPAVVQLSALSYTRLRKIAELDRLKVKDVPKVTAKFIGDTKVLIIRAAAETDRTAYEVHRYKRTAGGWFNLFELLGSHGLTVESGYRERFDVLYVPKGSPLWPGLLIDLGAPKERRLEKKKKKSDSASTETK